MLRRQPEVGRTAILVLFAVAAYAVLMFSARYVALSRLGPVAAGLLQAALGIALSTAAVLAPINTMLLAPRVNRAISEADKLEAAHAFVPRLLILFAAAGLTAVLAPELIVGMLFSHEFRGAAEVVVWFAFWQLLVQPANVYQQLLIGMDDVVGGAVGLGIGHLLSTALCFLWAARMGLAGIGLAFVIGGASATAFTVHRLRVTHHAKLPTDVIRMWAGTAAVLLVAYGVWLGTSPTGTGAVLRGVAGLGLAVALWLLMPGTVRFELRSLGARRVRES
jgi:O-antigen/teichoic acid export membrane protein